MCLLPKNIFQFLVFLKGFSNDGFARWTGMDDILPPFQAVFAVVCSLYGMAAKTRHSLDLFMTILAKNFERLWPDVLLDLNSVQVVRKSRPHKYLILNLGDLTCFWWLGWFNELFCKFLTERKKLSTNLDYFRKKGNKFEIFAHCNFASCFQIVCNKSLFLMWPLRWAMYKFFKNHLLYL